MESVAYAGLTIVFLVACVVYTQRRPRFANLPPGPPLPANARDHRSLLSGPKPWRKMRELSRQYGDILYLQIGPTPTIVLGSAQVAHDLLEKRSNIYSSRPRLIVSHEILHDGRRGSLAPYGPFWKSWRKAMHQGFMSRMTEDYKPIQVHESNAFVKDMLDSPDRYIRHMSRYAASTIIAVVYGKRIHDHDTDPTVLENERSIDFITHANVPGKYAVDSYPWLKHVPAVFAPWKKAALDQRVRDIALFTGLYEEVKVKMQKGRAPPCFARSMIELGHEKFGLREELDLIRTCATPCGLLHLIYMGAYTDVIADGAGVETTLGGLQVFLLACVHTGSTFVAKAHEELDRVVGSDRMPGFDDIPELPYVRAVCDEILRWRPVAVLGGAPHATVAEDNYRGYTIPKGATVVAPLWTLHLNEDDFPEPDRFDPERFLSQRRPYPYASGHSAFGFGRRVCPGQGLGLNSLQINVARLLWAFDLGPALDEKTGHPIPVDIHAFTNGFNSRPLPFPVSVTPRSEQHIKVIEKEFAESYDGLKAYE